MRLIFRIARFYLDLEIGVRPRDEAEAAPSVGFTPNPEAQ
jgi:hypothetical protein